MLLPLATLLLLAPALAAAHKIPLSKNPDLKIASDGVVNFDVVITNVQRAQSKFAANAANLKKNLAESRQKSPSKHKHKRGKQPPLAHGKRTAATTTPASELAYRGALWTGPISVGTPSRTLQMDMDTGSTDLIVCGASTCSNDKARTEYSTSNSSTAKDTKASFYNAYGDGSVTTGTVWKDTVKFGALTAKAQDLNVATKMGGVLASITADGLMGFAFPALSSIVNGSALSNTLYTQGQILSNTFAFRLSDSVGVSEAYIGGWNKKKMTGTISWYPMVRDSDQGVYTYLQLNNSNAIVNGKKVPGITATVIVDTGTTFILAPVTAAKTFWAAVPGSAALTGADVGYYSFPCATPPTVAFSFSGSSKPHYIAAADLNVGTVTDTHCLGAIVGNSGIGDSWILGDMFLKNQYTIFDVSKKQIGFATPA